MWSCPGNMPKYYPGLRHITRPKARPGQDHYTECLIVQVICQNITVPNITTETYTKYNNTCYHIFYCNMLIFACPIIANSQCWLFALRANIRICPRIQLPVSAQWSQRLYVKIQGKMMHKDMHKIVFQSN